MKVWKGYKMVVAESFEVQTDIMTYSVIYDQTQLYPDGRLYIGKGYPWDGNSGPLPDFKVTWEASCVHDILCDYVNMDLLPAHVQPLIDQEYYKSCVRKGMYWRAARQATLAVRWYMLGKGSKKFIRKTYEV